MERYIKGAEPFELGGGRRGCLLIHGFTGSPYEVRPLGESLAAAGYRVFGPVLAGHATDPADLDRTSWRDWVRSADEALTLLRADCDTVFVAGLSMGGLVASRLAAERPSDVAAVAILAAPLYLTGENGLFVAAALLSPLRFVVPRVKKTLEKDERLRAIRERNPSYDCVPTRAAASFGAFMVRSRFSIRRVRQPALLVFSRADQDVPYGNVHLFAWGLGSSVVRKVTLEDSAHLMTLDHEADRVCAEVRRFFDEF
ncbi:MAG: alpha/beta fold hydrolase [Deltaproteobacteria bacterium]|nr:alpha/beta fold hydrolase [Deltaproteobacteria bacterium]